MSRAIALAWSFCNVLTFKRYERLRAEYGDLGSALLSFGEPLLRALGCREDTAAEARRRFAAFDADAYERALEERGIVFLTIEDEAYPASLHTLPDPPVFLYARGDLSVLGRPCLALVGTRRMTPYGRRVARDVTESACAAGFTTVSGLAEGVDGEVALATLEAAGRTVAVLGHGLGMIFPAGHRPLAQRIVESGGLLLSEYALDVPTGKFTFPARNRIIAGLSLGTVVLQAPAESGAVITAQLALDYGREVFAVPGSVYDDSSAGCHALIASGGAQLVHSPADILQSLGAETPAAPAVSSYAPASPAEERLLELLSALPLPFDELARRSGVPPAEALTALTMMELARAVEKVGSGQWIRR